ncbi:lipid II:glycine glycyltransferase (peptidoglycan interpeptide bridge formation enzyme) [Peribacillus deserti]|uniref:Lipid II:glycine glycyltransferase (Peptidoglycan interpeptide bridge formation enzyme) n=1 Tax=Peribacillus deserti TaxID=673318 RepID=A0ABS2QFV7_9BACI|nr:hypothetical protein [Peribacillus deserti]MBM7691403.1 lipid II:glycine glycyltransferase (peptidoglycan interpeptide bridge formation enzyme) [Peribacillus deserti]
MKEQILGILEEILTAAQMLFILCLPYLIYFYIHRKELMEELKNR